MGIIMCRRRRRRRTNPRSEMHNDEIWVESSFDTNAFGEDDCQSIVLNLLNKLFDGFWLLKGVKKI